MHVPTHRPLSSWRALRPASLLLAWLCLLASLMAPAPARAEEQPEEYFHVPGSRALKLSVGIGLVSAEDDQGGQVDGSGQGLYLAAEYVIRPSSWFSPRLYAGLIIAPARSDCGAGVTPCDVSARFGFGGAKARLLAPIPWVAPFLELGLGVSLGRFSARSGQLVDKATSGFAYHVPLALGVALGPRRQWEVSALYLFHPQQQLTSGGVVLGLQLALD